MGATGAAPPQSNSRSQRCRPRCVSFYSCNIHPHPPTHPRTHIHTHVPSHTRLHARTHTCTRPHARTLAHTCTRPPARTHAAGHGGHDCCRGATHAQPGARPLVFQAPPPQQHCSTVVMALACWCGVQHCSRVVMVLACWCGVPPFSIVQPARTLPGQPPTHPLPLTAARGACLRARLPEGRSASSRLIPPVHCCARCRSGANGLPCPPSTPQREAHASLLACLKASAQPGNLMPTRSFLRSERNAVSPALHPPHSERRTLPCSPASRRSSSGRPAARRRWRG